MRGLSSIALASALGAAGCSSGDSGTLTLVTGGEDAGAVFAGVSKLDVQWVDSTGTAHEIVTQTLPASSIDLGSQSESTVGQIEVTGSNAAGQAILFGSTIPLQFGVLDQATVPLFVQRMGEMARMPSPPIDARPLPVLGTLSGRYLIATGGMDPAIATGSEIYDFLTMAALPNPPTLPVAAESMPILDLNASSDPLAWLVTTSGITAYDLVSAANDGAPTLPASGFTAADIAGGATVIASDGSRYVVGGTRLGHGPTAAVLKIDTSNNGTWLSLMTPRQGAAALWMDSFGLVVIGGSADGPAVEAIAPTTGTAGNAVAGFAAADPSVSVGAASLDGSRYVLLAGGFTPQLMDPGVRVLDLRCSGGGSTPCSVTWPALPMPIGWAQVFAANPSTGTVVGSKLAGLTTHVFSLTSTATTEVPTKVPHAGASAIANPLGTPGSFLLYGGADELEAFVPLPP